MKPVLAFDSACIGASIALLVNGKMHVRTLEQSQQAAQLVPAIDALLKEHGVTYKELGCIVTTTGPGSFTGVRIGLAALHGFVLVNSTPVKLVSTLAAMAWQAVRAAKPPRFVITLRAGKGEVYAQYFTCENDTPKAEGDIFLAPETKTDWDAPCFSDLPDAAVLCAIAELLPAATLVDAVPLYIRPPDALPPAPLAWLA